MNQTCVSQFAELTNLFQQQDKLLAKYLADIKDIGDLHVILTLIIVTLGVLGMLIVPYHDCGLHRHFAGSDCTCQREGQRV